MRQHRYIFGIQNGMADRKKTGSSWYVVGALSLALQLPGSFTLAQAADPYNDARLRIHRYTELNAQRLNLTSSNANNPRQRTKLSVYGKQLTLNLESNARVAENLPAHDATLLRGDLEGQQGSWVRLTRTAQGLHGLIWDGSELYAIEPSAEVVAALAVSLPTPGSDTVLFKLADTTDLGTEYCGSTEHAAASANTGLATYQALTAELSQPAGGAFSEPALRLELQVLTDAAYRAQYASDQEALDAIMVRLNNVDGIFSAQMGLSIVATDIEVHDADPPGLSGSTSASDLLNSLGQLRNGTPDMNRYAATHLFTGRDLDGDTLGIAYIGHICGTRYSTSLSEIRNRGAWIDSLVAAHELGHQLGAIHDGTGACAGTATQSYLMGAQINGNSELSACSRESIFATMQYASCLLPVTAPDSSATTDAAQPAVTPASTGGGGALSPAWLGLTLLAGLRRRLRPVKYRAACR